MRRMRRYTKELIIRGAVTAGIVACAAIAGAVAGHFESNSYLAQTLAYAEEPSAPAGAAPTLVPVEVDSNVHFRLEDIRWEGNTAWVQLANGGRAKLTLQKNLQDAVTAKLTEHALPYAGDVAIDPKTGRVLAIASTSTFRPTIDNYALRAKSPSASVFKLVTSAALLEKNAIDPYANVCYPPGAEGGLSESHVRGNSNLTLCHNLEYAIAHSTNALIARLAYQHLAREDLERIVLKFGFNREIPFEVPVDVSTTDFVEDDVERARSAAGFWHVNLSPMHGALIAAGIINDGIIMRPTLVDSVYDAQGTLVYTFSPHPWLVAMTTENAQTLAKMSEATTREGSGRNVFANRKGWKKGVRTGGKTGTLSNKKPFLVYNWYVGWGQLNDRSIAVGSVVVNTDKWWIKGTHVAARTIGEYFHE